MKIALAILATWSTAALSLADVTPRILETAIFAGF